MAERSFFEEQAEQSRVKSEIVSKYFWAWAKVIISHQKKDRLKDPEKVAYIDLFAGPGRYRDGKTSTPLMVLSQAIEDDDMRQRLVAIFNDRDEENQKTLENEINALAGIELLKHKPVVYNMIVGDRIAEMLEKQTHVPTLFFVDPWGYKGLSMRLVNSVLKDWGCDCIFFFNYTRINMCLENHMVVEHMNALFGQERADKLRKKLESMVPEERETEIVNELALALQEMGRRYVLPFCFKDASGARTSHHLIFVSKHILGYEIMKGIMARYSSSEDQGVPSFQYCPAMPEQLLLFELSRPLDDLADMLLTEFAGRKIRMVDAYNQHHVGRRYIKSNYKKALITLEEEGKIKVQPPAEKRRRGTLKDEAVITFPAKGG